MYEGVRSPCDMTSIELQLRLQSQFPAAVPPPHRRAGLVMRFVKRPRHALRVPCWTLDTRPTRTITPLPIAVFYE
jgi:hypothetical protein